MSSREDRDREPDPAIKGDIAIIGMACLFPGAPDLDTYWHNIMSKVDAITDPPPEAWDAETFYDPESTANDRVYCKRGGFIGPLAYFDPLKHGIMPRTVEGGEPDQWLALQIAYDARPASQHGGDNRPGHLPQPWQYNPLSARHADRADDGHPQDAPSRVHRG
jgi:hypothetical protein